MSTKRRSAGRRRDVPAKSSPLGTAATLTIIKTRWGFAGVVTEGSAVARIIIPLKTSRDVVDQAARSHPALALRASKIGGGSGAEVARVLVRYFDGQDIDPAALDVPLALDGIPEFARKVYRALRRVPRGETVSYGELAGRAGHPMACRATGSAMSRNPLPLLIPCHRVLAANARIGGFSSPGGVAEKERLLRLEGAIQG